MPAGKPKQPAVSDSEDPNEAPAESGTTDQNADLVRDAIRLLIAPFEFLREMDTRRYVLAVYGYFFMALTQGMQGISGDTANEDVVPIVGVTIAMAAILGIPVAAFIFGGLLHLFSRILGSQRAMLETIVAVGTVFFWPGLVSAISSLVHVMLAGEINVTIVIVGWYVAGMWALVLSTGAIRVLNNFSWFRAGLAWLMYVLLIATFWWLMRLFSGLGF